MPAASPPPCPKQIPQDSFWDPGRFQRSLLGTPRLPLGTFLVPWGTSWSLLGHLLGPGRKKRRKVTWSTLAPGSKLGLKIFTFPEKAAPNMKKMASQTGSGKRVLS